MEGYTKIGFTITAAGELTAISVLKTSGHAELDDAAVACAKKWHYKPAQENGAAVPVTWSATVKWSLSR